METPASGTAAVAPRHVFGLSADVRDGVAYLDEQTVLFSAGHNLVIHAAEGRAQRFVPCSEGSLGVVALAVAPNRKVVAVGEASATPGERPSVSVHDVHSLRRRRALPQPPAEVESTDLVCLGFSADSKALLVLHGAPDWTLCIWAWEKGKAPTAMLRAGSAVLRHASFSPHDNSALCVTGDGVAKFVRLSDGALKPIPVAMGRREAQAYTCHAWLADDRVLIGRRGPRARASSRALRLTRAAPPLGPRPSSLRRHGERPPARGRRGRAAPRAARARGRPNRRDLRALQGLRGGVRLGAACVRAGGRQGALPQGGGRAPASRGQPGGLARALARRGGAALRPRLLPAAHPAALGHRGAERARRPFWPPRARAPHWARHRWGRPARRPCSAPRPTARAAHLLTRSIPPRSAPPRAGLDVCVRKPLLASCGADRTVRLWDYAQRTAELCATFAEEPLCVAFHPSGLLLLVGFSDKLRLMAVLHAELRTHRELPVRGCREARFSHGGHLFAAANGSSAQVFNTLSCEVLHTLRGHNAKVRALAFTPDDGALVSAGVDGAVYEWDLKGGKRTGEHVLKSCAYNACAATEDARVVYAAGSDRKLREIKGESAQEWDMCAAAAAAQHPPRAC